MYCLYKSTFIFYFLIMYKYLVVLVVIIIGVVLGVSYIDNNDHHLSETSKVISQIPFNEAPLVIKQVPFTTTS